MIKNNSVEMFRLYSGEYIIGSRSESVTLNGITCTSDTIELMYPRSFVITPLSNMQVDVNFNPISLFSKKCKEEINISRSQIMVVIPNEDIPNEIISGYIAHVSGIKIATSADVNNMSKSSNSDNIVI